MNIVERHRDGKAQARRRLPPKKTFQKRIRNEKLCKKGGKSKAKHTRKQTNTIDQTLHGENKCPKKGQREPVSTRGQAPNTNKNMEACFKTKAKKLVKQKLKA